MKKASKPECQLQKVEAIEKEYQSLLNDFIQSEEPLVIGFDDAAAEDELKQITHEVVQFKNLIESFVSVFKGESVLSTVEMLDSLIQVKNRELVSNEIKSKYLLFSNATLKTSDSSLSIKLDKLIEITEFPEVVEGLINKIVDTPSFRYLRKYLEVYPLSEFYYAEGQGRVVCSIPEEVKQEIYDAHTDRISQEGISDYFFARRLAATLNSLVSNYGLGFKHHQEVLMNSNTTTNHILDLLELPKNKTYLGVYTGYKPNEILLMKSDTLKKNQL